MSHFLQYYFDHRQYFYSDRIIDSLYDCPPDIIWNGGRNVYIIQQAPIEQIIQSYRKFSDIHLRHTFTNCKLNSIMIKNYKCNDFVKRYVTPNDKIIINSPLLIEWFKNHYPYLELIYSTTLGITDINEVNELTKNNIYVMNYNYNNDNTYISKLTYPEHIEILCAEPCIPNCPHRMEHYEVISKTVMDSKSVDSEFIRANCPTYKMFLKTKFNFNDMQNFSTAISNERIDELSNMGIKYFKISGRHMPAEALLEIFIYYLVKPEHKCIVEQAMLAAKVIT